MRSKDKNVAQNKEWLKSRFPNFDLKKFNLSENHCAYDITQGQNKTACTFIALCQLVAFQNCEVGEFLYGQLVPIFKRVLIEQGRGFNEGTLTSEFLTILNDVFFEQEVLEVQTYSSIQRYNDQVIADLKHQPVIWIQRNRNHTTIVLHHNPTKAANRKSTFLILNTDGRNARNNPFLEFPENDILVTEQTLERNPLEFAFLNKISAAFDLSEAKSRLAEYLLTEPVLVLDRSDPCEAEFEGRNACEPCDKPPPEHERCVAVCGSGSQCSRKALTFKTLCRQHLNIFMGPLGK